MGTMKCVNDLCQKRERIIKHKNKRKQKTKCEVKKSNLQNQNSHGVIGDIDDILQYIEGEQKGTKKKNKAPTSTEDTSKKKQKKKIELSDPISPKNDVVVQPLPL